MSASPTGAGLYGSRLLGAANTWQAFSYAGSITSQAFIGFVEEWISAHPPTGKSVLVLDNASFHCSKDAVAKRQEWASQPVYLPYLPAYGSELNRIETLGHCLKHAWLELGAYANAQTLRQAVEDVLRQYGEKYTINFALTP